MFAKNLITFIKEITHEGEFALDMENEIHRDTLLTHGGEVVNPRVKDLLGITSTEPSPEPELESEPTPEPESTPESVKEE